MFLQYWIMTGFNYSLVPIRRHSSINRHTSFSWPCTFPKIWSVIINWIKTQFISSTKFYWLLWDCTLWFQLKETVQLISTFILFDPVLFPIYEARLLIGSILNFEALLGTPLIKQLSTYVLFISGFFKSRWNYLFWPPLFIGLN